VQLLRGHGLGLDLNLVLERPGLRRGRSIGGWAGMDIRVRSGVEVDGCRTIHEAIVRHGV